MTTTPPGADLSLIERDVTFLIADLAGFYGAHRDPRQPLCGLGHFALSDARSGHP
jgi:hypothetical protein